MNDSTSRSDSFLGFERIGSYRLLRQIGAGGMGVVYEAEQDNPRRLVALKLIRTNLATPKILKRFEHEAQVLGRLHHPGIAQVYEAGSTASRGVPQPFIAMEFVRGVPLNDYVRGRELDLKARLALFVEICDAVQHAHEKGVIHRDLKPANILVDDEGTPKVLDFGVARLTDSDVQAVTMQTDIGQLLGTLPYMSPEQAAAEPGELDARSDVYALGVLLYELLSGRMPYELPHFLGDAVRVICETEPTRLSTLHRSYRGDIETIVGHALEKEKERRYTSAKELATDIGRFLRDEPIFARPPSALYQARKFARRHKALVGGLTAVFIALVAGTVVSMLQAVRAGRAEKLANEKALEAQRDRALAVDREREARVEAAKSEAVRGFLEDMLASADPRVSGQRDIQVREILDRASERLDAGELEDQPEVRSSILRVLGDTYTALSELTSAEKHLRAALALAEASVPPRPGDLARIRHDLADALGSLDRHDEASQLIELAMAYDVAAFGEESTQVAADLDLLSKIRYQQTRREESEELTRRLVALREKLHGDRDSRYAAALTNLAFRLYERRDYSGALELLDRSVAILEALDGEELALAESLKQRSRVFAELRRNEACEADIRRSLDIYRSNFGDEHVYVGDMLDLLGSRSMERGRLDEAEPLLRESLAIRRRFYGDHHDTATTLTSLGGVLLERKDYDGALELIQEGLEMRRRLYGDENVAIGDSQRRIGSVLLARGDLAGAEAALLAALDVWRKTLGPEHADLSSAMFTLAKVMRARQRLDEAETYLRDALDLRVRASGAMAPDAMQVRDELIQVLIEREDWEDTETITGDVLALYREKLRTDHPAIAFVAIQRGRALAGLGRFAEAEPEMLASWPTLESNPKLWAETKHMAAAWIAELYREWGKAGDEASWREVAQRFDPRGR